MQTNYRFDPQEDLTALDLAEILDIPALSQVEFDKLPARLQRHFKAAQVFEQPAVFSEEIKPAKFENLSNVFKETKKIQRSRKAK